MPRTDSTGDGLPTRWRLRPAPAAAVAGVIVVVMGLAGCTATLGPTDGAVAQAARISALESEVATLRVRLADATAALETASSSDRTAGGVEVAMSVPRPERAVEAGGSAVRPTGDDDGGGDGDAAGILQWRIRTEDVRGRFVQTTGPAGVVAVTIDDGGEAVELGRWTIDAEAWRESLREGFLGTAYAIDLPVARIPADAQFLLARLLLEDIRLAEPLRLESPVPVIRPLPEARP